MTGPARRLIRSWGRTYTVQNATGGSGRSVPDYSDDGTLIGVLERRGRPQTATDSDGTDVETDLELRAVTDEATTLWPAGSNDGHPTLLKHPTGQTYRLLSTHPEDSGVTVLIVVNE